MRNVLLLALLVPIVALAAAAPVAADEGQPNVAMRPLVGSLDTIGGTAMASAV